MASEWHVRALDGQVWEVWSEGQLVGRGTEDEAWKMARAAASLARGPAFLHYRLREGVRIWPIFGKHQAKAEAIFRVGVGTVNGAAFAFAAGRETKRPVSCCPRDWLGGGARYNYLDLSSSVGTHPYFARKPRRLKSKLLTAKIPRAGPRSQRARRAQRNRICPLSTAGSHQCFPGKGYSGEKALRRRSSVRVWSAVGVQRITISLIRRLSRLAQRPGAAKLSHISGHGTRPDPSPVWELAGVGLQKKYIVLAR